MSPISRHFSIQLVLEAGKEVTQMAKAQEFVYAVVGAGDFAIDKVKDAGKFDRKKTQKLYKDFVKRGRTLSTKISNSAPTKQAVAQTKAARSQVKAAATSVGKAVGANAKAGRSAAGKASKAS
jgi:hypothetical protein